MRLIDADALMQEYARFVAPSNNSDFEDVPTWNDAVSLLGSAPTIEPERKKGKWILGEDQREEDISNGNYMFICSNCSHSDFHAKTVEVPYCWYCGADMRGTE